MRQMGQEWQGWQNLTSWHNLEVWHNWTRVKKVCYNMWQNMTVVTKGKHFVKWQVCQNATMWQNVKSLWNMTSVTKCDKLTKGEKCELWSQVVLEGENED